MIAERSEMPSVPVSFGCSPDRRGLSDNTTSSADTPMDVGRRVVKSQIMQEPYVWLVSSR
jgi:hypothetical protein